MTFPPTPRLHPLSRLCGFVFPSLAGFFIALALTGCPQKDSSDSKKQVLRVGHFPNVTHAQALVARGLSREGQRWFEERLGADVEIQWFVFNAGPSAMEGFFTDAIDLTYVGPNPALNAHIKSAGDEVRIIAGAALGGSALVVHPDAGISKPSDFRNRRIATPQLGNTQDVACRSWLKSHGFHVTQLGGDAHVIPTENANQLLLFHQRDVDAVWTVEPWVSRLELEAGGRIFLEEPDAITTVLVASSAFLKEHPELVKRFANAHRELTEWMIANPEEAMRLVGKELSVIMRKPLPDNVLKKSWSRLTFTADISLEPLEQFVQAAQKAGFLQGKADINRLLEIPQ